MDRIDRRILEILQENSAISNQELADMISLSPSPCLRRVKQLEKEGYIKKYAAILNPKKLGLNMKVFVMVTLDGHSEAKMEQFEKMVLGYPEIIQCHLLTGQSAQYMLEIVVRDLDHYQDVLFKKLSSSMIKNIESTFVLRSSSEKQVLPLENAI
ncbi:Lrp/AsnC family transcriptional regulator [Paraphotobacterium marinum]|uniref:Lrp/AsnC family transcriptional regulator n=1 Tax=Paraphotobacterium marinum TaxID=1755811 RepID=UPI001CEF8A1F|nr:Lrp/AsnC family transcriptional regulator [Paraphotobacterium marinum]